MLGNYKFNNIKKYYENVLCIIHEELSKLGK